MFTVCLICMRFFFGGGMPDLYLYEIFKEQTVCMCVYVLGVLDKTLSFFLTFPPKICSLFKPS